MYAAKNKLARHGTKTPGGKINSQIKIHTTKNS
jgi:hypothetical protein